MSPAVLALILTASAAGQPKMQPTGPPPAPAPAKAESDDHVLKAAGLSLTDEALLAFFRLRTPHTVSANEIAAQIKQLSAGAPAERDRAGAELIGLGHTALPALRRVALQTDDEETANRARKCIEHIDGPASASLAQAAARLIAARHPEGAIEALVGYLPYADDDSVVADVEAALLAIVREGSKSGSALERALTDPVPLRRAIAARVLCQSGRTSGRRAVRALLKDPKPTVRLRAALGLLESQEAEAMPVLIDLLAELPADGRKQAEEYLSQLAGEWAITVPSGNDRTAARLRREAWMAWWNAIDGTAILEEVRSRVLSDDERQKVLDEIARLDDVSPAIRDKAADTLVALGHKAAPLLRQVSASGKDRASAAAARCLEAIERDGPRPLPSAAPRLLALRRPEGAVEALLGYLPFAEPEIAPEIIDLLAAIGCPEGKAVTPLVNALGDKVAARRAAAATALCQGHADEHLAAIRKLLHDSDGTVRLRVALALASRGDREAVPALIALLGELPAEEVWEAEDYLARLAGEGAPGVLLEAEPSARTAAVEAWRKWWREQAKAIDLAKADAATRQLGLTLVIEQHNNIKGGNGRIFELSATGKQRWELPGLQFPWDAQMLPRGRILIAENNNRVTERDRDGKVVWEKTIPNAFGARRLPSGHTFLLGRQQVQLLSPKGDQVFSHTVNGWVLAGDCFRDGSIAYVTFQGAYVRLDMSGKQVKTFQVPFNQMFGVSGAQVLPGDRVIITTPNPGKVTEYDREGKVVWEATVMAPTYPTRTPNGHTLVPANNQTSLVEIDRRGKIISEKKDLPYRPFRVYRR